MNGQRRYLSYMLRLWETSNGEKQIWRASLESPGSGQRQGFANLETLMEFLDAQIRQVPPGSEEEAEQDNLESTEGATSLPTQS